MVTYKLVHKILAFLILHQTALQKCPGFALKGDLFQYYLDQPDIDWTRPACALPPLTGSFFEEVSEGDTLFPAEEYQGETTQNTAFEQFLYRDVTEITSEKRSARTL